METSVALNDELSKVEPSERVLLLSHCMRPSQTCRGKFDKKGLNCVLDCTENCVIRRCKEKAFKLGYKGVCIAAGGAMALRFVKENTPKAIIAVACNKEPEEGVEAVRALEKDLQQLPSVVVVPLLSDGCVDTEVDETQVMEALACGCNGGSPQKPDNSV